MLAATLTVLAHVGAPPLRAEDDEVYWVGQTYYYHLAFVEKDLFNSDWQLLPARENPPLGKYVLGAALHAGGVKIENLDLLGSFYILWGKPGAWGTGAALAKRQAVVDRVAPAVTASMKNGGAAPLQRRDRQIVRRFCMLLGALTAASICLVGIQAGAPFAGLIAALMFGMHPIVVRAYSTAKIDIVAAFFSVASVAVLQAILGETTRGKRGVGRRAGLVLLFGGALALACGSKMNSLIVVAIAVVAALPSAARLALRKPAPHDRLVLPMIAVSLGLAVAIFVGSNPTLLVNPGDGLAALSYEHRLSADIQEAALGGRLTNVFDRVVALFTMVGDNPIVILAMVASVPFQLQRALRTRSPFLLIVLWWVVSLVLLAAWLPFAWPRYAIPQIAPALLILAKSIEDVFTLAYSRPGAASS